MRRAQILKLRLLLCSRGLLRLLPLKLTNLLPHRASLELLRDVLHKAKVRNVIVSDARELQVHELASEHRVAPGHVHLCNLAPLGPLAHDLDVLLNQVWRLPDLACDTHSFRAEGRVLLHR